MDLYGIIGYPVKHSLSPLMHNAAFKELGIDAEYKKFEVRPEELEDFFDKLDQANIKGLNVTVPYKEKVLDFIKLDQKSFYLRNVKAVNTLVKTDQAWKGFNTDIPGFLKHLKELGFDAEDKKIAMLGAGGGSRAVSYALANKGAQSIDIFDIDKDKAQRLAEMLKSLFSGFLIKVVDNIDELDIPSKDALINATPIGLNKNDPCLVDKKMIHKDLFVYDLIYNPAETKLLSLAKAAGARYSNGLGMLLYQGVLSFTHWTSRKAEEVIGIMRKTLDNALK